MEKQQQQQEEQSVCPCVGMTAVAFPQWGVVHFYRCGQWFRATPETAINLSVGESIPTAPKEILHKHMVGLGVALLLGTRVCLHAREKVV